MKVRVANDLLMKYRKGATAGFDAGDWQVLVESVDLTSGTAARWQWETRRMGREIQHAVTAPSGQTFLLKKETGYRCIIFYDFQKWAVSQGLTADVIATIGPEPEKAGRRDTTNTGTCACCFGSYKLRQDPSRQAQHALMVLHGYQRPGWGSINGRCYGVRFQPYEVSCEGTRYLLGLVQGWLKTEREALARLEARPAELHVTRQKSRHEGPGVEHLVYTEADGHFYDGVLREKISESRFAIGRHERDAAFLTEKVSAWTIKPLPATEAA